MVKSKFRLILSKSDYKLTTFTTYCLINKELLDRARRKVFSETSIYSEKHIKPVQLFFK